MDVMISIRSNFFYTRTVPCELWHFDRAKPAERQDKVLMLDARNIYRKVTRKIYDFSPEQLQNLAAIVWLYRGQRDRFLALVQDYLGRTLRRSRRHRGQRRRVRAKPTTRCADAAAPFLKTRLPQRLAAAATLLKERDEAAKACFTSHWTQWTARIAKDLDRSRASRSSPRRRNASPNSTPSPRPAATSSRTWTCSSSSPRGGGRRRERTPTMRAHDAWDGRAIGRLEKELDDEAQGRRRTAQARRLLPAPGRTGCRSRFPTRKLVAVPGL